MPGAQRSITKRLRRLVFSKDRVTDSQLSTPSISSLKSDPAINKQGLQQATVAASDTPQPSNDLGGASRSQTVAEAAISGRSILQQIWDEALETTKSSKEHAKIHTAIDNEIRPMIEHDGQTLSPTTVANLVRDIGNQLRDRSQQSQPRRLLQEAVGLIDKFVSVGDIAVSSDPIHAALPWATVRFVLVSLTAGIELDDKVMEGLTLITLTFARCNLYTSLYLTPNEQDVVHQTADSSTEAALKDNCQKGLRQAIVEIYSNALLFLGQMIYSQRRSQAARTLNATFDLSKLTMHLQELKDSEKVLNKASKDCDKVLHNIVQRRDLNNIFNIIDRISALQDTAQRIFDNTRSVWLRTQLSPVNAAILNHFDNDGALCLPGTRVDLLAQVREWACGANQPSIFWLEGAAGTGKSTISRTVARMLSEGDAHIATFFFNRNDGDRNHGRRFFTTLALQAALQFPSWYQHVVDALTAEPELATSYIAEQFEKLIRRPLGEQQSFESATASASSILSDKLIIVIDALDECDKKDIIIIFRLILSVKLRCFITTRPDYKVKSFLGDEDPHVLRILHRMDEHATRNDIRLYMTHEIDQFKIEYNREMSDQDDLALPENWPGHQILHSLTGISFPLFIVAVTICRMLSDVDWPLSPQEKIQSLLKKWNAGQTAVGYIYTQILDRVKDADPTGLQGATGQSFRAILGSIILMFDSLNAACLSNLLQFSGMGKFNKAMLLSRLRPLHAVLDVAEAERPIKPFHLSFRDYLLDSRTPDAFRIDEKQGHLSLAHMCRRLLLDRLKPNICDVAPPGMSHADIDQSLINERLNPELRYAVLYWIQHLKASGSTLEDGDPFHKLLESKFLMWLEALSLMSQMSEGLRQVKLLQDLISERNGTLVSDFLKDGRRFILYFQQIIRDVPLQVYHSGLVFSPTGSLIRKTFERLDVPDWPLDVLPAVKADWDWYVQALDETNRSIRCFDIAEDGKLAVGYEDGEVQVWEPSSGEKLFSLPVAYCGASAVAFSLDVRLATATWEQISIWNMEDGLCLQSIARLDGEDEFTVGSMAFSEDACRLSTASLRDTVMMYDLKSGQVLRKLDLVHVNLRILSSRGTWIAVTDYSDTTKLARWEVKPYSTTSEEMTFIPAHKFRCRNGHRFAHSKDCIAFSPNESLLLIRCEGSLVVWDIEKRTQVHWCTVEASIQAMSLSNRSLAISSTNGPAMIWKLGQTQTVELREHHFGRSERIGICEKNNYLISIDFWSTSGTIKVWDLTIPSTTPSSTQELAGCIHGIWFSSCADVLVSQVSHEIAIHDAREKKKIISLPNVTKFAVAEFQPLLAVVYDDEEGKIQIRNVKDQSIGTQINTFCAESIPIAFSKDGTRLLSYGTIVRTLGGDLPDDATRQMPLVQSTDPTQTSTQTGHLEKFVKESHSFGSCSGTTSSGVAMEDHTNYHVYEIQIWDVATGSCEWKITINSAPIAITMFGTEHITLAFSSRDGLIRIYDLSGDSPVSPHVRVEMPDIAKLDFSETGSQLLATGEWDAGYEAWLLDATSGSLIRRFQDIPYRGRRKSVRFEDLNLQERDIRIRYTAPSEPDVEDFWIWKNDSRLIWLPQDYRDVFMAISGESLAIVTASRQTFLFRFKDATSEANGSPPNESLASGSER